MRTASFIFPKRNTKLSFEFDIEMFSMNYIRAFYYVKGKGGGGGG